MNTHHQNLYPQTLSRYSRYALLACTLMMSGWVQAQLAIQSLTAAAQGGGGELVRIQTNEPLRQLPAGFSMQAPARIALDIPGASNATGQNLFELNQGNLRSANVVQAGDRTRIVLNLSQPVGYELRIEGNTLLVQLQPGRRRPHRRRGARWAQRLQQQAQLRARNRWLTSTLGAAHKTPGGCWSSWPAARPAWTCASKGATWWWSSSRARCPKACAGAST